MKLVNLALRFLLELCALGALGYWGYRAGSGAVLKVGLAIAAPLLAAIVWGLFISPKATIRVPVWLWLLLQAIVFGLAIAGLLATGHPTLGIAFLAALAINGILLYVWRQ